MVDKNAVYSGEIDSVGDQTMNECGTESDRKLQQNVITRRDGQCARVRRGESNLFNLDRFECPSCCELVKLVIPPGEVYYYLVPIVLSSRVLFAFVIEFHAISTGFKQCALPQTRAHENKNDSQHAPSSSTALRKTISVDLALSIAI